MIEILIRKSKVDTKEKIFSENHWCKDFAHDVATSRKQYKKEIKIIIVSVVVRKNIERRI